MSSTYILSQILIVVAYSLSATSYLASNRKGILVCNSCSLVSEGMAYFLLSAWSGVCMVLIASFRNLLFFGQTKFLEKRPEFKKYEWVSLALVLGLGLLASILTFNQIFSTFCLVSSMIYAVSIWQKNKKVYKILGIIACVFLIAYNVFIGSLFGAIMESLLMTWIVVTTFTNIEIKFKFEKVRKKNVE